MGATPIPDLAIAMSLSLSLTVNRSIEVHCTHNKSLSRSLTVNRPLNLQLATCAFGGKGKFWCLAMRNFQLQ